MGFQKGKILWAAASQNDRVMETCFRWKEINWHYFYRLPKSLWTCVSSNFTSKTQASDLCGDSFDWTVNYLNNWQQFVSVNGTNSEKIRLTSGMPQDSLLGPRPLSIFTYDLPLTLDSKLKMFADDSTAYIIGNSTASIQSKFKNSCINYLPGLNSTLCSSIQSSLK